LTIQLKGGIVGMTGKELIRRLKKEGWELDRVNGSHHIMIKRGKTLSVPVHSNKDLPSGLLIRLMKDGGLR
jgi:predicted RNA binding protein YcfA (HicA-like mRNA interferase family)